MQKTEAISMGNPRISLPSFSPPSSMRLLGLSCPDYETHLPHSNSIIYSRGNFRVLCNGTVIIRKQKCLFFFFLNTLLISLQLEIKLQEIRKLLHIAKARVQLRVAHPLTCNLSICNKTVLFWWWLNFDRSQFFGHFWTLAACQWKGSVWFSGQQEAGTSSTEQIFSQTLDWHKQHLLFLSADITEMFLSAWTHIDSHCSCNNGTKLHHRQDGDPSEMTKDRLENNEIWELLKFLSSMHQVSQNCNSLILLLPNVIFSCWRR